MKNSNSFNVQSTMAIRLLRLLRYNKVRSERALELLDDKQRPLFHILPFLLHINHPSYPGYIEDERVPFGLQNYSKRSQLDDALLKLFPGNQPLNANLAKIWPREKKIDSLSLMGSIGTIAQSGKSDFDYWVCVDSKTLGGRAMRLLAQKLELIENWAEMFHQLEVHFFICDIEKVKNNDFGAADGESAGSAQALFLKSEYYATHIVVAGKAPYWWLMPENTEDDLYYELISELKKGTSPDPDWFMDLGNLTRLDPGELFGAAIWQIVKAMDSPFKSVLKMAKLEVFLHNIEHGKPLCSMVRKRVQSGLQAPGGLEHVDPYAVMFDALTEHYEQTEQKEIVRLLRICLYIKCGCQLSVPEDNEDKTFKRIIMEHYVKEWGWSKAAVMRLDEVGQWDFVDKSRLSQQIHSFLVNCYRRISSKLEDMKQLVSQQDMTVIGRKIEAFYAKKDNKVHYLRSAFDNELYCSTVTVKATKPIGEQREWHLYAGDKIGLPIQEIKRTKLNSHASPIHLMAWSIWNRLASSSTEFLLDYNTEPVTEQDLQDLSKVLHKLFAPIKVSELSREDLLGPRKIETCLIVLNFEVRRESGNVRSETVLYTTNWGEMYIEDGDGAFDRIKPHLDVNKDKLNACLFAPQGSHKTRLYEQYQQTKDVRFRYQL